MSTEKQDDPPMEVDTEQLESDTSLPKESEDVQEDEISHEGVEENGDQEQETVGKSDASKDVSKAVLKDQGDSEPLELVLQDQVVQKFRDALSMGSLQSFVEGGDEMEELEDQLEHEGELPGNVFLSQNCTLKRDYLDIEYSFGYDSYKNFNICCPDPDHLVFLSGCFIHILDLTTKLVELRSGSGGQGLGCITKNHSKPHIAIGEKGQNPSVVIYEWPSFDVVSILRGGSTKQYTCLDYDPTGEILVSQSGEPDHWISIWNWRSRQIILKVKSHAQGVYNVRFSKYVTGHLSSSGLGHIKMWKMVNTFTSLKLLGTMGRFGKTTTCDILAVYLMPDEKVLSGCEWGNILVWDDGLIKLEVSRKQRRPCHEQQIVQFLYDPEALQITTVGADGFIRVWNYQTIDLANPPEDEKFVELEPILEIQVKEGIFEAQLMHIVECPGTDDNTWFGQDKKGGFWRLHVEVTTSLRPAEKLYVTLAGAVLDMSASPTGLYLACVGAWGRLSIWSVEDRRVVLFYDSAPNKITHILWLPTKAYKSGCAMVVGFACGLVKVFIIRLKEKLSDPDSNRAGFDETNEAKWLHIIQVLKPHTAAVNYLITNPRATQVISGSEDRTVFIFGLKNLQDKNLVFLEPIGFVETMGGVCHFYWHTEQRNSLLVSCNNGYSMLIQIPPDLPSLSGKSSYKISKLKTKAARFQSVKSKLTRYAYMRKVQALKDAKLKRKKQQAEEAKKKNPALEFDEYYFYDSQEEIYLKDLPPEYTPPEPNAILFTIPMGPAPAQPSPDADLVWVSVDGYDAGYLYGVTLREGPVVEEEERVQEIIQLPNNTDVPATCVFQDPSKNYLYVGFGDGTLRLIEIDPEAPTDLSRYIQLATHDRQYGRIRRLCMSADQTRLYSCGDDGNVFSYFIQDPSRDAVPTPLEFSNIKIKDLDIAVPEFIESSLEEEKQKIRQGDRVLQVQENKRKLLSNLNILQQQLSLILKRLDDIPEHLKPSEEDFELDPRITQASRKMAKEPLDLIKKKMRYKIEKSRCGYEKLYNYFLQSVDCFYKHLFDSKCEGYVTSFALRKLKPDFDAELERLISQKEPNTQDSFNLPEVMREPLVPSKEEVKEGPELNQKKPSFLKDLESFKHKLPLRTQRALKKYYEGREEIGSQRRPETGLERSKTEVESSLDCATVEDAEPATVIGNYTMKSDPQYRVPKDKRTSHKTKMLQILKTQKEIYNLKKNFNNKLEALQEEKFESILKMKQLQHEMKQRQVFVPKKFHMAFPSIPCFNYEMGHPEKKFQIDDQNRLEQFEPQNNWTSPELDLLKPPPNVGSPLSEILNKVPADAIPEVISHLEADKKDEVSQIVFTLDDLGRTLEPLVMPHSPSSLPPRDAHTHAPSYATLPENEDADMYGSSSFFSVPDLASTSSKLSTLEASEHDAAPSDICMMNMEDMFKLDLEESPLEKELRKDTVLRLILDQALISAEVNKNKESFDKKVHNLSLERFKVAESVKLLELFLLTLQEETVVLDRFKGGETAIQIMIDEEAVNVQGKLEKIAEMEKHIRANNEQISQLKEKVKEVEDSFAAFNRNAPRYILLYLKHIFLKKMKMRKVKPVKAVKARKSSGAEDKSSSKKYSEYRDDCSDYTTSSEEEEEEEDEQEMELDDKENGGAVEKDEEDVWDENQPPAGMNPKTLKAVLQLRMQRHEFEEEIAVIKTKTDNIVKEIMLVTNSIKYLRSVMEKRNEDLDKIITEKQKNLNQVETTVVLRVSQLKNEEASLSECIVMPSSQLAWLNDRSYELKKQTEAQKKQFQDVEKVVNRIKNENTRLQEQYRALLGQVSEATVKKYGRLVNVAALEEAVLQALIHEVRIDVPNIVKSLDADLKQKQLKLEEENSELLKMIKSKTDSFRFFVTLKEEKTQLEREIATINSKKKLEEEKHKQSQSNYEQDIAKLSTIYNTMQHEEVVIMRELCDLTHKSIRHPTKLPPIKKETRVKKKPKEPAMDRETALKNATRKIKEILESLDVESPDVVSYNHLVEDLQELYGLNIKGTDSNENVDDVVDVLVDLTTKQEESNIGVSNAEVIKATLSMLLLDIEQNEGQSQKTHEGEDNASVESDAEDEADIIKVSFQPDEGEGIARGNDTGELSEDRTTKTEDVETNKGEVDSEADEEMSHEENIDS